MCVGARCRASTEEEAHEVICSCQSHDQKDFLVLPSVWTRAEPSLVAKYSSVCARTSSFRTAGSRQLSIEEDTGARREQSSGPKDNSKAHAQTMQQGRLCPTKEDHPPCEPGTSKLQSTPRLSSDEDTSERDKSSMTHFLHFWIAAIRKRKRNLGVPHHISIEPGQIGTFGLLL